MQTPCPYCRQQVTDGVRFKYHVDRCPVLTGGPQYVYSRGLWPKTTHKVCPRCFGKGPITIPPQYHGGFPSGGDCPDCYGTGKGEALR